MEYNKNFGKVLLGTAVILIGGLLLMDNLDITYFPWRHYLLSWKSIMIFIGLVLLTTQKNLVTGIILITLGSVFWLPEMLNYTISLQQVFLPSILIVVGLVVIFKTRHQRGRSSDVFSENNEPEVRVINEPENK
jgi:predicted membrane protein